MSFKKRNPRTRPVFKLSAIDDQEKFKPLPVPSGKYPYRLDAGLLVPDLLPGKIVFHMTGDTGGIGTRDFQKMVVGEMTRQFEVSSANERPRFLFHLGDVVYNFGQASQYYDQFFSPYQNYPAPIFAIAGNHDADIDPFDQSSPQSLDAFRTVFCDTKSKALTLAGDTGRKSNIQPNIYFTLQTPLADIIGVYSNVPRFGTITEDQKEWFINELKTSAAAKNKKALIVCVHHAPYSADINHGSSIHMQRFLTGSFAAAGVRPDIVFSGHVHNYQRFNKYYPDGKVIPFIVSGAGGYEGLHPLAQPGDPGFPDSSTLLDDVELQNYCDDAHGFLKITIADEGPGILLSGEYYTVSHDHDTDARAVLYDSFSLNIEK